MLLKPNVAHSELPHDTSSSQKVVHDNPARTAGYDFYVVIHGLFASLIASISRIPHYSYGEMTFYLTPPTHIISILVRFLGLTSLGSDVWPFASDYGLFDNTALERHCRKTAGACLEHPVHL
jgi:hypothetical protein